MCAPCNARCAFHPTRAPIPCHSSQPTSFLSPFSRRLSLLANPIRGLTTASYSAPPATSETPVALPPLFLRPQYTCSFRQPSACSPCTCIHSHGHASRTPSNFPPSLLMASFAAAISSEPAPTLFCANNAPPTFASGTHSSQQRAFQPTTVPQPRHTAPDASYSAQPPLPSPTPT
ncbi:unnamed protein product [Chondrus crispus]|uniref:Uncharacterized protein n=1 Tax=Chondrus crispus TaxID=2769 RepID=R7Q984_CHOCR|nr:unnamed protein product [Chondrus crispus]CDF34015.1 unnamed protein product [Chondrus crispus]|eukprot:XP_005713834.1 unnamed protein product [Chondrus crispus]